MSVVLEPPVSPAAEVQVIYALDNSPPASGADGLALIEQYRGAFARWLDRPSNAPTLQLDDDGIRHVPLKKVGTIRVRFKRSTPMKPRTIDSELDETE